MAPNDTLSYLDYNATTPVLPEVIESVTADLHRYGNPSSMHAAGRRARAAVEDAREAVAGVVNASPQHVIFTSGGTEANALALHGLAKAGNCSAVLASAVEHPSVLAHVVDTNRIAVDSKGVINLQELERALRSHPAPVLIALMLANNETGAVQPLLQAVELARKYGARIHCDAVQAVGKIPVDMWALGVDSMSLSAHKFGGMKGAGALVLRGGVEIAADMLGGGQERRRRAGTENVPGIIGFGAAARQVQRLLAEAERITKLRNDLETQIKTRTPQARIFAQGVERLGNTSCITLPGVSSETQIMRLDLAGVAVSCSSGKIAPSHVLLAMGVDPAEAKSAIRVSLGCGTAEKDISRFLEAWRPLATNTAA
jgi:cysteine desulfurase